MTAPRYGGGGLLQIKGRAQPEAEISKRVPSENDPDLGHVRR